MQSYIGTKRINATPMTRIAYNQFRGWTLPEDENGDDAGFLNASRIKGSHAAIKSGMLAAEAALNLDDKTRNQQLCQIQKDVWQQAPWIFLWSQTLVLAYNSKITGVSYLPNEKFVTMGAYPTR